MNSAQQAYLLATMQHETSKRPKNIRPKHVMVARPSTHGGVPVPIGYIFPVVVPDVEKWIKDNKHDDLVPIDGRTIDKDRYPELYEFMLEHYGKATMPMFEEYALE